MVQQNRLVYYYSFWYRYSRCFNPYDDETKLNDTETEMLFIAGFYHSDAFVSTQIYNLYRNYEKNGLKQFL